jgi:hypothetical protein
VRFLADEDFSPPSVRVLSEADHDVAAVILETPGAFTKRFSSGPRVRAELCSPSTGTTVGCSTGKARRSPKG